MKRPLFFKKNSNNITPAIYKIWHWSERALWLLFMALAVSSLVFIDKDNKHVHAVYTSIQQSLIPVISFIQEPVSYVSGVYNQVIDHINLYESYTILKQEHTQLTYWQHYATQLEAEHKELQELLNYKPKIGESFTTARLILEGGGIIGKQWFIDKGHYNWIGVNDVVMSSLGAVGLVRNVNEHQASIMRFTDINSMVPIKIAYSDIEAILQGKNQPLAVLQFVQGNDKPAIGMRIVTSGRGDVYMPGLAIGEIVGYEDNQYYVKIYAEEKTPNFVTIYKYKQ